MADVRQPASVAETVDGVVHAIERGVAARGLARSYGDAAQNAGGGILDMTRLADIGPVSADGLVTLGAGASIDDVLAAVIPQGWFVPVTPGTRQVTIGGAIAADVHGKNHHTEGSFCDHVRQLTLVLADGSTHVVGPAAADESDRELFWATAGGMGLTGIVVEAEVQLLPISTALIAVDTDRVPNLDELLSEMETGDAAYRYSVAWIDLLASGRDLGRSVLTRGDHAPLESLPRRAATDPLRWTPPRAATVPAVVPGGLLRPVTVRAFNELWYRKAPARRRGALESVQAFFHPLDGLRWWNRLYGPSGFLQYQFVVPPGATETVRAVVEALSGANTPSFLAVLKRFGPANEGILSFPMEGWTLALDVPTITPGLPQLLDQLDDWVLEAGGRVYLAKDSRLSPDTFRQMYPRRDEFVTMCRAIDPQQRFRTDLSRRLQLTDA